MIEKSLAGTIGLIVKFSTLQEYGVDKPFFLENHNVDSSQRNIVFMVRGENAKKIRMVAGKLPFPHRLYVEVQSITALKVECAVVFLLPCVFSLDAKIESASGSSTKLHEPCPLVQYLDHLLTY